MPNHDDLHVSLESSAFPCDRLRVRKLSGTEAISHLFDFELEVVSLDHDGPAASAMMGALASVVIEGAASSTWQGIRRIHGMIAEVDDQLATHADFRVYRVRLVPRAFALTLVTTHDIFLNTSVPQIVAQKLDAVALSADTSMRLTGTYAPREFTIQYRESDYALMCRLTEHLGVSFFFEQGDEREAIVFTDHNGGFPRLDGDSLVYRPRGEQRDVFALHEKRRLVPAYHAVLDYNYRLPQLDVTGEHELTHGFAGGIVEYATHHKTPEEGKVLARVRAEEAFAGELVYTGKSAIPALAAGVRFTLDEHPDLKPFELLVTEIEHRATQIVPGLDTPQEAPSYVNTFRAIPADRAYRPPRVTPRPRIAGLVTGFVAPSPAGATRHAPIDEQGRYWIRLPFDMSAPGERPPSRPIRMIQNHAGENYGTHFPLKIGAEVVVAFIDGDPDRPLIVGAVPNPIKPSPVTSANPNVHRIRTSGGITIDIVDE
jgi:type VI secretion system secreted protein VgrG